MNPTLKNSNEFEFSLEISQNNDSEVSAAQHFYHPQIDLTQQQNQLQSPVGLAQHVLPRLGPTTSLYGGVPTHHQHVQGIDLISIAQEGLIR
jgi:hypothetical protein